VCHHFIHKYYVRAEAVHFEWVSNLQRGFCENRRTADDSAWLESSSHLLQSGVDWRDGKLIGNLCKDQAAFVQTGEGLSSACLVGRGVRQGFCKSTDTFKWHLKTRLFNMSALPHRAPLYLRTPWCYISVYYYCYYYYYYYYYYYWLSPSLYLIHGEAVVKEATYKTQLGVLAGGQVCNVIRLADVKTVM